MTKLNNKKRKKNKKKNFDLEPEESVSKDLTYK